MTSPCALLLTALVAYSAIAGVELRLVGGWNKVPTHEEGVQNVAHFASKVISDRSNSYYHVKLIHVHEASRQVVAGWKYNVTFDMAPTICRKNEAVGETRDQCTLSQDSTIDRCVASIWERPWLKERQLLHFECKPFLTYEKYFEDATVAADQAFHAEQDKAPAEGTKTAKY